MWSEVFPPSRRSGSASTHIHTHTRARARTHTRARANTHTSGCQCFSLVIVFSWYTCIYQSEDLQLIEKILSLTDTHLINFQYQRYVFNTQFQRSVVTQVN